MNTHDNSTISHKIQVTGGTKADNLANGFTLTPKAIVCDATISYQARLLLIHYYGRYNLKKGETFTQCNDKRFVWPADSLVASELGMPLSTVKKAKAELIKAGYITMHDKPHTRSKNVRLESVINAKSWHDTIKRIVAIGTQNDEIDDK